MDENKNTVLWSFETLDDLQDKNPHTTLFVIGNGFDLLHGVPSRTWISETGLIYLVMETLLMN